MTWTTSLNAPWRSQTRNLEFSMSEKLLSVVIPTYNMEAYLRRCLDSVTHADVPSSLELIVVNDGSTDDSLAIMQEYAKKRPDIVNIIDKPNGHYGSCVNAALKIATGKYFRILDADDWFDTNGLITLLKTLAITDSDLVITSYCCHRNHSTYIIQPRITDYTKDYSPEDSSIWNKQNPSLFAMHAFTYKRAVLLDVGLKLTEGICYTDTEYLLYPLSLVRSIIFSQNTLYHYDWTREGQSMDKDVYARNHNHLARIILRFFNELNLSNYLCELIFKDSLVKYYYRMLFCCNDDKELKEIDTFVIQNKKLKCYINKKLFRAPSLWRTFGIHFFFYEKIKTILGIER